MLDLDAIYTVLVEECGAREDGREMFLAVRDEVRRELPIEYRFQGALGFGGKFRYHPTWLPYVDCYPEDLTPERRAMIERANKRLAEFTDETTEPTRGGS